MADYRTVLLFQTKPYGTWLTTVRYYYFKLRTVFPSRQGQFASLCTVRDSYSTRTETFLLNRTVLRFEIPYGILIARCEIYMLHTVRDSHWNRTGSLSFVHFEQHYTYLPYGISIYTVRYVLFPASSSCSCQFLGRITTRNRPDLRVRDTGHSLLFVGLPRTGSFPTSTHTHRTGFPANSLKPYGIFVPVFCIPYGLQKP